MQCVEKFTYGNEIIFIYCGRPKELFSIADKLQFNIHAKTLCFMILMRYFCTREVMNREGERSKYETD